MNLISDVAGVAIAALLLIFAFYGVILLGGIGLYVLQSLGLYTLAQRRGIRKAWMAWVPVLNLWTLGSLSDQYQYVVKHRFHSRRKLLLGLAIGMAVLSAAYSVLYAGGIINLVAKLPQLASVQEMLYMLRYQPVLMAAAGVSCVMWVLGLLQAVFQYLCLWDVYASCRPDRKVLYTVLSILVPVTMPFFLFSCRNADKGMPPRKTADN